MKMVRKKKKGSIKGLWTQWYENGQKKGKGYYKDQRPFGKHILWYDGGQKRSEVHFASGIPNGYSIEWYENGQKERRRQYD